MKNILNFFINIRTQHPRWTLYGNDSISAKYFEKLCFVHKIGILAFKSKQLVSKQYLPHPNKSVILLITDLNITFATNKKQWIANNNKILTFQKLTPVDVKPVCFYFLLVLSEKRQISLKNNEFIFNSA